MIVTIEPMIDTSAEFDTVEDEERWVAVHSARIARQYTIDEVCNYLGLFYRHGWSVDSAPFATLQRAAVLLSLVVEGPATRERFETRQRELSDLARLTASHLSVASLEFLRGVQDGTVDVHNSMVHTGDGAFRWFTHADENDIDDLTEDGLIDRWGVVTDMGALVLDCAFGNDNNESEDG